MSAAFRALVFAFCAGFVASGQSDQVFRSTTTLQSVPVRVVDKSGKDVNGLTAQDFTLLEDGKPQQISFFATGRVPVSLAVLLDTSRSMDYGGKLERARDFLTPLLRANNPDDEIFFVPFTGQVEAFEQITAEHPARLPVFKPGSEGRGTAFYDALASALCHLRTARNVLQAIVIVTDGADQHSHLNLDQLIALTQSSNAQIFTVGLIEASEYRVFSERTPKITLLGERDIDNPMVVFDRLAKESGAESFFPRSDEDFRQALGRIAAILQAQYTLAYYPKDSARFRRIEVKVRRSGVRVLARRGAGAEAAAGIVHFLASSCEVSATEHPYPWEPHTSRSPSGALLYREDFSDPASGWPVRKEKKAPTQTQQSLVTIESSPRNGGMQVPTQMPSVTETISEYWPGLRYVPGGYEIARTQPPGAGSTLSGTVVAYGPSWDDFRASLSVETDWSQPNDESFGTQAGMVFGLSDLGYCMLLLRGVGEKNKRGIAYELVKRSPPEGQITTLIPWTNLAAPAPMQMSRSQPHTVSVERRKGAIEVRVDDRAVPSPRAEENSLEHGLVGFGLFGEGRAVFRDLRVESLK